MKSHQYGKLIAMYTGILVMLFLLLPVSSFGAGSQKSETITNGIALHYNSDDKVLDCTYTSGSDTTTKISKETLAGLGITYDAKNNTWIFDGVNLRFHKEANYGIFITGSSNIKLTGDNTISRASLTAGNANDSVFAGIYCTGDLTFTGDGNLTASNSEVNFPKYYCIIANGNLTFSGSGSVAVSSTGSGTNYGVYCTETVNINNGTLSVTGSTAGIYGKSVELTGGVTTVDGGIQLKSGGSVSVQGGLTLKNGSSNCRFNVNGSSLTLESGSIKDVSFKGNGGAVSVTNGSSFTMNGGSITGCTATGNGGGVYVDGSSFFDMYGGSITGCTATGKGGGVYKEAPGKGTELGMVRLYGTVTISGSKAGSADSNLYLASGAMVYLDGTDKPLTGGSIGISMEAPGTFSEPVGYESVSALTGYFFPDSTGYRVKSREKSGTEEAGLYLTDQVQYTVSFDANGHGTAPASQKVYSGEKAAAPANSPSAEGYAFRGWYKEAACTNAWDFTTDTVTKDITLYAGWECPAVSFSYENNILTITGSGAISDYTSIGTTPWSPYADEAIEVIIGAGITRIGDYAFANMKNLKQVDISAKDITIGDYAFSNDPELNNVYFLDKNAYPVFDTIEKEKNKYSTALCGDGSVQVYYSCVNPNKTDLQGCILWLDATVTLKDKHLNCNVIPGYAPTETEYGRTDGVYCLDCKQTITAQEIIYPNGKAETGKYNIIDFSALKNVPQSIQNAKSGSTEKVEKILVKLTDEMAKEYVKDYNTVKKMRTGEATEYDIDSVWLSVDTSLNAVSEVARRKLTEAAQGRNAVIFDMSMFGKAGDVVYDFSDTTLLFTYVAFININLDSMQNIEILHLHDENGSVETIDSEIDRIDSFLTNKGIQIEVETLKPVGVSWASKSPFAIVYDEVPDTGDSEASGLWLWIGLAGISFLAFGAVLLLRRKKS